MIKQQNFLLMLLFSAALFSFSATILSGYLLLESLIPIDVKDSIKNKPIVRRLAYYLTDPSIFPRTGQEIGDGGSPTTAALKDPTGIYINARGDIFFCERRNHRIRKISQGIVSTVAGNGWIGFSRDGIPAPRARVSFPEGLVGDSARNLFVADRENHRIRRISQDGIIRTVAGTGTPGFSGDGGPAGESRLSSPTDVGIGPSGSLYVADWGNHRVRRIAPDGIMTTVAGNGQPGFSGDGGPAIDASLNEPYGLAVDSLGNIYAADSGNHRIRKVSPDGTITTIAGNGKMGFSGDGGMATDAQLNSPQAVFVAPSGEVFIDDEHNRRIRKISLSGLIETVAGNGNGGYCGDGGPATEACLNDPEHIWADASGNLFITDGDTRWGVVRKVNTQGIITAIAGGGRIAYP